MSSIENVSSQIFNNVEVLRFFDVNSVKYDLTKDTWSISYKLPIPVKTRGYYGGTSTRRTASVKGATFNEALTALRAVIDKDMDKKIAQRQKEADAAQKKAQQLQEEADRLRRETQMFMSFRDVEVEDSTNEFSIAEYFGSDEARDESITLGDDN